MYQNVLYIRPDLKITKTNKLSLYNTINNDFNKEVCECDGYYADGFTIGNESTARHKHFFFKVKPGSQCISCFNNGYVWGHVPREGEEYMFHREESRIVENTNYCDIANIKDLDMKIEYSQIHSIINGKGARLIVDEGDEDNFIGLEDYDFKKIIDDINNKKIKGVVAFVSIHA